MEPTWSEWLYAKGHRGKSQPTELLIGCPVMKRDWIISHWFEYAYNAAREAGYVPGFIFVLDMNDQPMANMILNMAKLYSVNLYICDIDEVERNDIRDWNVLSRLERMVYLRNLLLEGVRKIAPKYFLSLDSDILIEKTAIVSLIDNLVANEWDAIGGKTFMGHVGTEFPSYGNFRRGSTAIYRENQDGVFRVDCIMAIKLMTAAAYGVNYVYAQEGEDIGFSNACTSQGLKLGWDGSHTSKHVMRIDDLNKLDIRCGY